MQRKEEEEGDPLAGRSEKFQKTSCGKEFIKDGIGLTAEKKKRSAGKGEQNKGNSRRKKGDGG